MSEKCWVLLYSASGICFRVDFVMLVIISFLIAVPLSYYFMHGWLQNYNYRINMSWWIFAAAGSGALFVTFVTVSFQAIKAAIASPVKSLRTE
ncbi:MAG: hypothetical protein WDM78_11290 [Puia sp.]